MDHPIKKLAAVVGGLALAGLLFIACAAVGRSCEDASDRVLDAAMDATGVDAEPDAEESDTELWFRLAEDFAE